MSPVMKITTADIEKINAYGPFNHSVWRGKGITVTNEEGLAGRAAFLSRSVRKIILHAYPPKKLAKKTIADVGAYDGWLLHSLEDLPFQTLVGIEPRRKNIEKGNQIRTLLGIQSRITFVQTAVEMLPKKKFDIVLCIGTLHHLESIPLALRKLDTICNGMLIIETLCLPGTHESPEFMRDIEMKDIIYTHKKPIAGLTGHKFESSYYDGSALGTTVVSVPSVRTLLMYLDALGYEAKVEARPQDFKRAMPKNSRPSQEVLISARKKHARLESATPEHIAAHERGLVDTVLPRVVMLPLFERYCLGKKNRLAGDAKAIAKHINDPRRPLAGLGSLKRNPFALEIARTLRFNPFEKIALEWGKVLWHERKLPKALAVLQSVTGRPNADWRATYRSFYILSRIYTVMRNKKKSLYYEQLCKTANPDFAHIMYSR